MTTRVDSVEPWYSFSTTVSYTLRVMKEKEREWHRRRSLKDILNDEWRLSLLPSSPVGSLVVRHSRRRIYYIPLRIYRIGSLSVFLLQCQQSNPVFGILQSYSEDHGPVPIILSQSSYLSIVPMFTVHVYRKS